MAWLQDALLQMAEEISPRKQPPSKPAVHLATTFAIAWL